MSNPCISLIRRDTLDFKGGDNVQIKAISDFLNKKGYRTEIRVDIKECKEGEWIVLFNLTKPIDFFYNFFQAIDKNCRILIFPIYWNLDKSVPKFGFFKKLISNIIPNETLYHLKLFSRIIKDEKIRSLGIKRHFEMANRKKIFKKIVRQSERVFVNSNSEMKHLIEEFKLESDESYNKVKVCYNGIEQSIESDLPSIDTPDFNYICCIGAIGPRKNQLNIVQAMKDIDTELVLYLIGDASFSDLRYWKKVKKKSNQKVVFLKHLPRTEVLGLIQGSQGLVQTSFIETPGLAAMEAVSLNIPILVSDTPPVKEYFGDLAIYCNPYDIEDIKNGISKMASTSLDEKKVKDFKKKYEWDYALEPLLHFLNSEKL